MRRVWFGQVNSDHGAAERMTVRWGDAARRLGQPPRKGLWSRLRGSEAGAAVSGVGRLPGQHSGT